MLIAWEAVASLSHHSELVIKEEYASCEEEYAYKIYARDDSMGFCLIITDKLWWSFQKLVIVVAEYLYLHLFGLLENPHKSI